MLSAGARDRTLISQLETQRRGQLVPTKHPATLNTVMDARKGSSLSVRSDGSDSSLHSVMNLVLEPVGTIEFGLGAESESEKIIGRSVSSCGNYISVLCGENTVFIAELRLRPDCQDCIPVRSATLELPGIEDKKKYLNCCLLEHGAELRLGLLGERKNKERFVSIVEVVTNTGRSLSLGCEMSVYDKASMLGKNLTHLTSCGSGDIFSCGNLIRKLKMEDGGSVLKPTSGRAQVPPECVDGTLSLNVMSSPQKNTFTIVCSFKTKSAGKNKYQINWFQGRNDDISAPAGKSSLKLSEEQEPSVILSDPRDARSVFVVCNNPGDNSSALYKLVRGRKLEEPITTFTFPVTEACMMLGADKNLFLLIMDNANSGLKVFNVTKTQGYRGAAVSWSRLSELHGSMSATQHAVSCSTAKWQLSPNLTDTLLSPRCPYQIALATLVTANNDIVNEPESGAPYRLRALGGDNINDAILIILDDIERCFESEEDSLSSLTLKICMNMSLGRDGMSMVSGWLMAGRLASVEIFSTRLDNDSYMDSDRLVMQTLSPDTLR